MDNLLAVKLCSVGGFGFKRLINPSSLEEHGSLFEILPKTKSAVFRQLLKV